MRGLFIGLMALIVSLNLFSAPLQIGANSDGFRLVSETDEEVVVEFKLPNYSIEKLDTGKDLFNVITTTSQAYTSQIGKPYLPIFATGIAVANQGRVSYEIIESEYSELPMENIFPSQKEGFVYKNISLEEYAYSGFFPNSEVSQGEAFVLRDLRVKPIQVKPFLYNKTKKTLRVFNKLVIKVTTDTRQAGVNEITAPRAISPAFQKLYQATLLNYHRTDNDNYTPNILFIHKANNDPIFQLKLEQYTKIKRQKGFNVRSVSTSDIGSSSTSGIKNYIQNLYDGTEFRPDYVVLVGDVSGTFGIPTYNASYADNAEGDYPYTHLAGNDLVGDIFIGRMSVNNSTDLSRYVGKMKSYEGFTNPNDTSYLDNMLLVADTDPSGESTVNHCKFVKQISTMVNPEHQYTEVYGNNPNSTDMNQAINDGIDFFVYRGYIGMSGWNPGGAQTNTHKLNHGVIITCATGNFASTGTTEEYVNLGTETAPKGGLTAIGMATSFTHTSFNNSLSGGIFHGIYNLGQRTMGQALLTGKITTHIVYSESDMSDVKKFTHWCNLIGDPTVDVYTGQPDSFIAEVSDFYPDSQTLVVIAKNQNNIPVNSAVVTLTNESGEITKAFTNAEGVANLQLEEGETEYTLTIDKTNHFPLQESIQVSGSDLRITSLIIDDDNEGSSQGNNNQNIEAGENIEVNFMIENLTANDINNIQANLSVNNYQIQMEEATSQITTLTGNSSSLFDSNFSFNVNNSINNNTEIAFILDLAYGTGQNLRLYYLADVNNGNLIITDSNVVMLGESLQANQTATISVTLENQSDILVENVEAKMIIDNGHFSVLTDNILIPSLATYQSQTLDFQISSAIDMFPGMTTECILKFDNEINFYQESRFDVKFGDLGNTSPLGPDMFGYVIYDSNDIDYPECPEYDWVEIAPINGGSGTELDIYDPDAQGEGDGVGSNSTDVVDLPFQYIFYGQSYNQITVCSNGFISFGANSNGEFRNWRLPGALGPNGMIAPFWDDMHMSSNSGIYTYYDSQEDYFVIQWEQMINGAANNPAEETFQLILYNPQRNSSSLNQGTAKIQYKTFNNVDNGNPGSYTPWHGNYATIGIESPCGTMGLEYTYNQNYPAGAHELEDGMALFITTKPVLLLEPNISIFDVNIVEEENDGNFEIGEEIKIGLALINTALTPLTNPTATITTLEPRVTITNNQTVFEDLVMDQESYSRDYFTIELNEEINDGEIITLNIEITGDEEYRFYKDINLTVSKPSIMSDTVIINDYQALGNNNSIPEAGETVRIAWTIKNTSGVDGFLDSANISTDNSYLTFDNTTINNIRIKAHSKQQAIFTATISSSAPQYEAIELLFSGQLNGTQVLENNFVMALNTSETSIDFEDNQNPVSIASPWEIGSSSYTSAHSGDNILGTNLNSQYPNDSDITAWTEFIDVNPSSSFSFWHKYAIESNYDGGQIVARIEGASSNIILTPDSGYPNPNLPALGGPGFDGNLGTWTQVNVTLPQSLLGNSVKFGFRFASDFMVTDQGWFIDDIVIGGAVTESFVFTGNVTLNGGSSDPSYVNLFISDYVLSPQTDGLYQALLPFDSYQAIYSLTSYRSDSFDISNIDSNQLISHDLVMNYLNSPENLTKSLQDSILTLNWDYAEDLDDELTYFILEEKINTGEWEDFAQIQDTQHTIVLHEDNIYSYRVKAIYQNDSSNLSNEVTVEYMTGTDNEINDVSLVTRLHGNYPNPFNPTTNIAYSIAKPSNVKLKIYNLKGQLVKSLLNEYKAVGNHKTVWNGKNNQNKPVSSGIYFIRIETDNYTKTSKAILMK